MDTATTTAPQPSSNNGGSDANVVTNGAGPPSQQHQMMYAGYWQPPPYPGQQMQMDPNQGYMMHHAPPGAGGPESWGSPTSASANGTMAMDPSQHFSQQAYQMQQQGWGPPPPDCPNTTGGNNASSGGGGPQYQKMQTPQQNAAAQQQQYMMYGGWPPHPQNGYHPYDPHMMPPPHMMQYPPGGQHGGYMMPNGAPHPMQMHGSGYPMENGGMAMHPQMSNEQGLPGTQSGGYMPMQPMQNSQGNNNPANSTAPKTPKRQVKKGASQKNAKLKMEQIHSSDSAHHNSGNMLPSILTSLDASNLSTDDISKAMSNDSSSVHNSSGTTIKRPRPNRPRHEVPTVPSAAAHDLGYRLAHNLAEPVPQCRCLAPKDEPSILASDSDSPLSYSHNETREGAFYSQLGVGASLAEIRKLMTNRFAGLLDVPSTTSSSSSHSIYDDASGPIRLEAIQHARKDAHTVHGCPLAKWIIRRSGPHEKVLVLVKVRPGHVCQYSHVIVAVVLWDGLTKTTADETYTQLTQMLPHHGQETERKCSVNSKRTCACQGWNPGRGGSSFTFGCTWSMFYNGCKFATSSRARKFRLKSSTHEETLQKRFDKLSDYISPVFAKIAPDAFRNQTWYDSVNENKCRLGTNPPNKPKEKEQQQTPKNGGVKVEKVEVSSLSGGSSGLASPLRQVGRPFAGATATMDFCAHAHYDNNDIMNGCAVVATLTTQDVAAPRKFAPSPNNHGDGIGGDEQLHTLPWYMPADVESDAYKHKLTTGSIEVLTKFPMITRIRTVPLKSCRERGRDFASAANRERQAVVAALQPSVPTKTPSRPPSPVLPPRPPPSKKRDPNQPPLAPSCSANISAAIDSVVARLADEYDQQCVAAGIVSVGDHHPIPDILKDCRHPSNGGSTGATPNTPPPTKTASPAATDASSSEVALTGQSPIRSGCGDDMPDEVASNQPSSVHNVPAPPSVSSATNDLGGLFPADELLGEYPLAPQSITEIDSSSPHAMGVPASEPQDSVPPSDPSNNARSDDLLVLSEESQTKIPPPCAKTPPLPMSIKNEIQGITDSSMFKMTPSSFCNTPAIPPPSASCHLPEQIDPPPAVGTTFVHDNIEAFESPPDETGGISIALTHGSLLFEVAKRELHATTALRQPDRFRPTRMSLIFFHHKSLNDPGHSYAKYKAQREAAGPGPSKTKLIKLEKEARRKGIPFVPPPIPDSNDANVAISQHSAPSSQPSQPHNFYPDHHHQPLPGYGQPPPPSSFMHNELISLQPHGDSQQQTGVSTSETDSSPTKKKKKRKAEPSEENHASKVAVLSNLDGTIASCVSGNGGVATDDPSSKPIKKKRDRPRKKTTPSSSANETVHSDPIITQGDLVFTQLTSPSKSQQSIDAAASSESTASPAKKPARSRKKAPVVLDENGIPIPVTPKKNKKASGSSSTANGGGGGDKSSNAGATGSSGEDKTEDDSAAIGPGGKKKKKKPPIKVNMEYTWMWPCSVNLPQDSCTSTVMSVSLIKPDCLVTGPYSDWFAFPPYQSNPATTQAVVSEGQSSTTSATEVVPPAAPSTTSMASSVPTFSTTSPKPSDSVAGEPQQDLFPLLSSVTSQPGDEDDDEAAVKALLPPLPVTTPSHPQTASSTS